MSTCISKEIVCAKCGAKQKIRAWPSVTVRHSPELREQVMNETLFNWQCEKCGYQSLVVYPFLYHDTDRRFMIALNPDPDAKKLESPPLLDGLQKRVVRLPAELKEKILIFEAGLDDMAMELAKLLVILPLRKKYNTDKLHLYFCERMGDQIRYALFVPGHPDPVTVAGKWEIYEQCLSIKKEFDFDTTGFMTVDQPFALRLFDEYQKS